MEPCHLLDEYITLFNTLSCELKPQEGKVDSYKMASKGISIFKPINVNY